MDSAVEKPSVESLSQRVLYREALLAHMNDVLYLATTENLSRCGGSRTFWTEAPEVSEVFARRRGRRINIDPQLLGAAGRAVNPQD